MIQKGFSTYSKKQAKVFPGIMSNNVEITYSFDKLMRRKKRLHIYIYSYMGENKRSD